MTDPELIAFTTEFRDGILNGGSPQAMCMAVCLPLVSLLRCHGVDCCLSKGDVGNWNHVWINLADGRILDPTASQFSDEMPDVFLGKIPVGYR